MQGAEPVMFDQSANGFFSLGTCKEQIELHFEIQWHVFFSCKAQTPTASSEVQKQGETANTGDSGE